MKIHYLFALLFFIQITYSQKEKTISGKVVCGIFPISKVDVIDLTSNSVAVTDTNGAFSLLVHEGDLLVVFLNGYYDKKITISNSDLATDVLLLELLKKPIELDEVVVANEYLPKMKYNQGASDDLKLAKEAARPKVIGVYDGTIPNGIDFIRLGGDVAKLFRSIFHKAGDEQHKKKASPKFETYLASNFEASFYTNTLQLKAEDITIFKEYCELDQQSKGLMEGSIDHLKVLDFLIVKSVAFKKIRAE